MSTTLNTKATSSVPTRGYATLSGNLIGQHSRELQCRELQRGAPVVGIQDAKDAKSLSEEDHSRILWHACDAGDLSMVKCVIEAGCDVEDHMRPSQGVLRKK